MSLETLTKLILRQEQRNKRYNKEIEIEKTSFLYKLSFGSRGRGQSTSRGRERTPNTRSQSKGRWQENRGRGQSIPLRDARVCFNYGKPRHFSNSCRAFNICYHCGQTGHFPYQCSQRRANIQRGKRTARNYSKKQNNSKGDEEEKIAFTVTLTASLKDEDARYINLCASNHMTGHRKWFESLKPYSLNKLVELGNKYPLNIQGIGMIAIKIKGKV